LLKSGEELAAGNIEKSAWRLTVIKVKRREYCHIDSGHREMQMGLKSI
jgi:hypothetical protein